MGYFITLVHDSGSLSGWYSTDSPPGKGNLKEDFALADSVFQNFKSTAENQELQVFVSY